MREDRIPPTQVRTCASGNASQYREWLMLSRPFRRGGGRHRCVKTTVFTFLCGRSIEMDQVRYAVRSSNYPNSPDSAYFGSHTTLKRYQQNSAPLLQYDELITPED